MQPYKSHELLTTVRLEFVLECAANETHTVKKGAPMLVPSLTCTPPQALVTCVLLHHLESDPVWDCSETFRNASSEDKDCQAFLSFLWRLSCCSQSMETAKAYGQTLDILSCSSQMMWDLWATSLLSWLLCGDMEEGIMLTLMCYPPSCENSVSFWSPSFCSLTGIYQDTDHTCTGRKEGSKEGAINSIACWGWLWPTSIVPLDSGSKLTTHLILLEHRNLSEAWELKT